MSQIVETPATIMFEMYILLGVSALILGLIGYARILYAKGEALKAKLQVAVDNAEKAQAVNLQSAKTAEAVSEVQKERREKQLKELSEIDKGAPRNHFDTTEF